LSPENSAEQANLLGKGPKELDATQGQHIVTFMILACLRQPDEPAFRLVRSWKRGALRIAFEEIIVVGLPINLPPTPAIEGTFNNP
jgi:hypothetical protein